MSQQEPETYEEALEALTEMQRAFVIAYSGNATEAGRIAGYSSPGPAGCRLLKQSKIQHALALRSEHEAAIDAQQAGQPDVNPLVEDERLEAVVGRRLERQEQLDHARITREQLEQFLAGVVTGAVREHGMTALGQAWSGPPKLRDRLRAAQMLAKMNHWNRSDGGGEHDEGTDPFGHGKLSREELEERARETARKLIVLEGGG